MSTALVRDLMTRDVITLSEADDVLSAEKIMRLERLRHLPVTRAQRLVGLVTHRDLIRAQAKLLSALAQAAGDEERLVTVTAGEIMSEALLTCSADTPADDAARMMLDAKIGCLLVVDREVVDGEVVDGERLVGIVTESDVVQWAIEMMAKQRFDESR